MDALLAGSIINAGVNAGKGILGTATSIANATNSESTSHSNNESWQNGASSGYSASNASGWGYSDNWSDSIGENFAESHEGSTATTYGREASAEAIKRAQEANEQNYELWKMQADFNASEAEKSRIYQTEMANTAYQRAVKDLIKAGINPILAYSTMGSATPTGATASSGLATAHKADTFAQSESSSSGWSKNYGYNKSHAEGHSKNANQSSSYAENQSYNEGYANGWSNSNSNTKTQLMDLIGTMGNMINGTTSGQKANTGTLNKNSPISNPIGSGTKGKQIQKTNTKGGGQNKDYIY